MKAYHNHEIIGKNIDLYLVDLIDAEFILSLRLDSEINKYLSPVKNDLDQQKEWIKSYKDKERLGLEYYFTIANKEAEKIGTVRIYEIDKKQQQCTFGSFIINKATSHSKHSALEAMTLALSFAFSELGLQNCFFDCRKENERANKFYARYRASLIDEDTDNLFYRYTKEDLENHLGHYRSLINQ